MLYSLAEFESGNVTTIRVTANATTFSISDDGRGHPIDKTIEGISYLKFIYTHFDYPFASGRAVPIQLQGIGMSMINALCSELTLTVRKQSEALELRFRDGQLHQESRTEMHSVETGITISAKLNPHLQRNDVAIRQLEEWLLAVLATCPALKLYFNGRQLMLPA
jgi:DNA gyrase subunit B